MPPKKHAATRCFMSHLEHSVFDEATFRHQAVPRPDLAPLERHREAKDVECLPLVLHQKRATVRERVLF